MAVIVYGIPNCDTVKKALDWLKQHEVEYTFHNYKKDGVPKEKLKQWVAAHGWKVLLNKQGTTWRKLSTDQQSAITNKTAAIKLMLEYPSIIKRPVVEFNNILLVGFHPNEYSGLLK